MLPTLLLTRPRAQAERFAAQCRARFGADLRIVISPILEIALRPVTLPLSADTVLIFSSQNAVRAYSQVAEGAGRKAYCVGDRTAAAAQAAGFDAVSAGGAAEALIALIEAEAPSAPMAYLHGDTIRVDVAKALQIKGFPVNAQAVYAQTPLSLSEAAANVLEGPNPVLLPIFSPRSAELLATATQRAAAPLYVIALSSNIAEAWTRADSRIDANITIAEHHDASHMLDKIASTLVDTFS